MRKIDKYIIQNLFRNFFFILFLFLFIAIAINVSERIDMLIASGLGARDIIVQYYAGFIPYMAVLLFPILSFVAVVVLTSRLAAHSEIIAIRSSGISYRRFLFPYFMAAFILTAIDWGLINFILPKANEVRTSFESKYQVNKPVNADKDYFNALYLRINKNSFVTLKNYASYTQKADLFFVDSIQGDGLIRRIYGNNLQWNNIKQQWIGKQITIESGFSKRTIKKIQLDSMSFSFGFTPNDAKLDVHLKDKLSRSDLRIYIEKEKKRGSDIRLLQLELFKRDATPLLVLLLTLMAAMLSSKKLRGGRGMHILLGAALMGMYVFIDKISATFAVKASFPAWLAAWTPHLIFVGICFYIYHTNKKSAV